MIVRIIRALIAFTVAGLPVSIEAVAVAIEAALLLQ
jgi:hypothetical protein